MNQRGLLQRASFELGEHLSMRPSSKSDSQERKRSFHLLDRLMKPILPRPVRSIIERQHVALSRCVFAFGLPGNGILPELDDRQTITVRLQNSLCHSPQKMSRGSVQCWTHFLTQPLDN